ncbi:hypothetical protein KAH81_08515 [bacterium]|nr:hypothetical protein [bacterium]
MKKWFLLLSLGFAISVFSQDSLTWCPNPKIAAGLSLLIPGTGQIYNKSYWKAPIAMGLEGYTGYVIIDSWKKMNNLEDFGRGLDENSPEYAITRNDWEKTRELRNIHLWLLTGFILLSSIDAYVDAHLYPWVSEMARPIERTETGFMLSPIADSNGGLGVGIRLTLDLP